MQHQLRTFNQLLFAMLGLAFVLIMVALDQTVIGTALPTMVAELNGFDLYAWVGTSYLLSSVIAVPIFGKLGDEHGRKVFVIAAIIIFTLASILCGLAQSMMQLVIARGLQGIGGGMIVATSFASVPDLFPDAHERLRWQVILSTAFGLASAVGPYLGGYLTEYWGWRWVFFVNLPVGLVSLFFVWRHLPKIRHSEHPPSPLDWLGSVLLALMLGSLQILLEWLPLNKPIQALLELAILAVVSFIGLLWWEKRAKNPVVPLEMFKNAKLRPLFGISLLMGFSMFGIMYYSPLMFQGGFGLSPNQAGLLITPLAVFITVGSILNGRIIVRIKRPQYLLYLGTSLFALSVLMLTQISNASSHYLIFLIMSLGGLGLGFVLPNLTILGQAGAPRHQLGVATAMMQSIRMVGSMLGTALIGILITHVYSHEVHKSLELVHQDSWDSWLSGPQILVSEHLSNRFLIAASKIGVDGVELLNQARHDLVQTIQLSQWMILVVILLTFMFVKSLSELKLERQR